MLRVIVWALAVFFVASSISWTLTSNLTAGLIMMYIISVALVLWGTFYHPLAAFTAHGVGRVLKWLVAAGVLVYFGIAVFLAVAPSVTGATGGEQAIVVLGAGLRGDRVSGTLRRRLDAAYDFACAHPDLPVVVTGGQGPGETRTEASAMKEYLLDRGLAADRVLLEDRSTSTRENFLFARQVLAENGHPAVDTVAFVTNRFHCYRAGLIAGRLGLQANAVPATLGPSSILPCYLREVLAVLYYWLIQRA